MSTVQQAAIGYRVTRIAPARGVYTFRADRPYHWLQRICLTILEWIGASDLPKREVARIHTFGPVEQANLHKVIGQTLHEIIRWDGWERRPKNLYIGAQDWSQITDNPLADQLYSRITMKSPRMAGEEEGLYVEPYNIKINIVPWMKGWVLI